MRKMENKQLSIHKQMYNIYIYINIVVIHMFVKKKSRLVGSSEIHRDYHLRIR